MVGAFATTTKVSISGICWASRIVGILLPVLYGVWEFDVDGLHANHLSVGRVNSGYTNVYIIFPGVEFDGAFVTVVWVFDVYQVSLGSL